MRNTFLIVGFAVVITTAIGLMIADYFGGIGEASAGMIASLVAASALALVVGNSAFRRYGDRPGQAVRHIAIWLAIGLCLALVYRWRGPLSEAFGFA